MKKVNHILNKILLALITVTLSASAFAGANNDWTNAFVQNFDNLADGAYSESIISEVTDNFSAEVRGGAFEVKSDNTCEFVTLDASTVNSTTNSNGITLSNPSKISKLSTPKVLDGKGTFEYQCGSGDIGYLVDEIGGRKALKLFTYYTSGDNVRTNSYRFKVDAGRFTEKDNKFEVEVQLYIPDYQASTRYVFFTYWSKEGTSTIKKLENNAITGNTDGWYTWTFTAENMCLSKTITESVMQKNFQITIPGYSSSVYNSSTYIHSIKIKNLSESVPEFSEKNKSVLIPVSDDSVLGSTKLSFDMTLPENEALTDSVNYNTGKNAMQFGIANDGKKDVATLELDVTASGETLYAISENGSGEKVKTQLYTGDLLGKTLNYELALSMENRNYTVTIKDGDNVLVNNQGPFDINNGSAVIGSVLGKYLSIKHSPQSDALMSVVDNIVLDYKPSEEYLKCKEDSDAIVLDIPESGIVEENLTLPTAGSNNSQIFWESADDSVVEIVGNTAVLKLGETVKDAKITSTTKINDFEVKREFTFKIPKHPDFVKLEEDVAAIVIETPAGGIFKENFELPAVGTINGSTIAWESLDTDLIEVVDYVANIHRKDENKTVKLVATVSFGDFTKEREFEVEIEENDDHKKAKADVDAISLEFSTEKKAKKNFELPSVGTVNNNSIVWSSNNAAIVIENGVAKITRGENDVTVQLKATVVVGEFTVERSFPVTVASTADLFVTLGPITESVSNNKLTASCVIANPAKEGNLSFVAFSIDPETGKIRDRKSDTKVIDASNKYSNVTFEITDLSKIPTDEVKYFYWNDGEVSVVNNSPSPVGDIEITDLVKGVRLDWEESLDDNGAVDYYTIFRDNVLIGQTTQSEFADVSIEKGVKYNYTVVATDTNELTSGDSDVECTSTREMYYIDYDRMGGVGTDYLYGMQAAPFVDDSARDAYAFVTQVTDATGAKSYAATTTTKYILGKTNKEFVSGDDRDLVFEVTYLDTEGKITINYNTVVPSGAEDNTTYARKSAVVVESMTGTRTWKTAVVRIDEANFRESRHMSLCDYGLRCSVESQMFIKEVKIIQAELYD